MLLFYQADESKNIYRKGKILLIYPMYELFSNYLSFLITIMWNNLFYSIYANEFHDVQLNFLVPYKKQF
jgi:hypothetical protein